MLTKTDLKNIQHLVSESIQTETPKIVRTIIQEETPKIVRSIIQEETPKIVEDIVGRKLKPIARKINKIDKTLFVATKLLDEDLGKLRRRVDKIETQLGQ